MITSLILAACYIALPVSAIWPQPVSMTTGDGVLWLDSSIKASFYCESSLLFTSNNAAPSWQPWGYWNSSGGGNQYGALTEAGIVQEAVQDSLKAVAQTKFIPWKFYSRGTQFEPGPSNSSQTLASVTITQTKCPPKSFNPNTYFYDDESYEISVDSTGVNIQSNSTLATLRALETFKQLFYMHSVQRRSYVPQVPIHIADSPTWSHRGVSLDIARNPYGPDDVIHTIDAMASSKFSRLHVHATDSQSWPLEIPSLPELAAKGAYQPYLVWSVADLAKVQQYGAKKGIAVVIETDMPGHTASIAEAYPELIAAFNQLDWSHFAAEPESGQLKLNDSRVTDFINTLMDDLLPRVSPYTPIFHMGGDEFNQNVYLLDETVNSNSSDVIQPLLAAFVSNVLSHVQKNGLRPMVWQELVLQWNLTLPRSNDSSVPGTLVQVWINSTYIEQVLERGHSVIFGDYEHWYLDCGFGTFVNPYPSGYSPPGVPYGNETGGVPTAIKDPFLDYCNPMKNWKHIYVYNPLQNITSDLHHLVEGGEVLLWSEQADPVDMDFKLWPRAASAGEVLWSGPRNSSMIRDASERLSRWRERAVVDLGVRSSPAQMTWCLMEGGCDW